MVEKWADIKGYEGLYKISTKGRVKSLIQWNGHEYVKKERILKGWVQEVDDGYKRQMVGLTKNSKSKIFRVHRLVGEAFIQNPEEKPEINHIDGDSLNNIVDNLEWVTSSENSYHAYKIGLKKSFRLYEDEIVEDYKSGLTQLEISKKYRCAQESVRGVLKARDIKIRASAEVNKKYDIDKIELMKDFGNGMKNVDIAKKYNTNRHLIGTYKYKYKKGELV